MSGSAPGAYPAAALDGQHAYVLVGPTAIGKTAVAAHLAREDGLTLLSADSMNVYRGMSVGTAKPAPGEVPPLGYAGLDLAAPSEEFSTGDYLEHARRAAADAASAGRPLAVVGGTGLYIKALLSGLERTVRPTPMVRDAVRELFERDGVEGLQAALRIESPDHWEALQDPSNPRRLMRALELARMDLAPPADWRSTQGAAAQVVGLDMDRTALRHRIYERVQQMYQDGLVEEAQSLRAAGGLSETARQAIGYAEAFALLDGRLSREEAIYRTVVRTCQLAKKQGTFFRNQIPVHWIEVRSDDAVETVADRVRAGWRSTGPARLSMSGGRMELAAQATDGTTPYRTMKELPVEERPREAFERKGAAAMSEAGLLALLLRTGTRGVNASDLAVQLMKHHLTLTQLSLASVEDLAQFKGIGRTKAQILKAALEIGRRLVEESHDQRAEVRTPEQAARTVRALAQRAEQEIFWVMILDTRYRLLRAPVEVSKGILDASLVHPREVFREAIRAGARAVILAHNHPSGDVSPSSEDLRITRQLIDAGRILDIEVLDHVIVNRGGGDERQAYLSLRESGLVSFEG